ncbi:MAG TPA: hypothetical protein VEY13_01705 [Rubrobacteraceae bacterium]|nr:hypothetical protein [Rubrobacteraceae bacterium]
MSALLDTTSIKASGSRSVVSFEQPAHEGYAGWSRYLTLDGEKAYFIGGACDTCAFVFERMGGASRNVSPGEAADGLRRGLSKIEDAPISTISEFVPGGSYRVNLLQLSPTLVTPGTALDSFAHAQAALWGTDAFWGLPHHPKTEYYRAASIPLGGKQTPLRVRGPHVPEGLVEQEDPDLLCRPALQ